MDLGPMPGLDMLFYEMVLLGVLVVESLVLVALAAFLTAAPPMGKTRPWSAFAAVPIGIGFPLFTGIVTWLWTYREIQAPSAYHADVDAVAASYVYLIAATIVSFVGALVFLGAQSWRVARRMRAG